jgi:hypothetical protein
VATYNIRQYRKNNETTFISNEKRCKCKEKLKFTLEQAVKAQGGGVVP